MIIILLCVSTIPGRVDAEGFQIYRILMSTPPPHLVVSSLPPLFDARRGLLTPSVACFVHVCFLLSTVMMCVALCQRQVDLFTKVVADNMKNDSLTIHDIKPRSGNFPD